MSEAPIATESIELTVRADARGLSARLAAFAELSKARLSALVVVTAAVGYLVAAGPGNLHWPRFLALVVGTTLAALGANSFNQWLEVDRDRRMNRTRKRPLPSGELNSNEAAAFSVFCSLAGPLLLLWYVGLAVGLLGLATIALYTLVYTPLKVRTPANTLVGAVVGAIPPMMGWAAAGASLLHPGAWLLAALLFAWQMPHFLALAWLYREDYARGGFRMLPAVDASGSWTAATALIHSIALLPITAGLTIIGLCGWAQLVLGVACGAGLCLLSLRLLQQRSQGRARALFLGSIAYLPIVLTIMVLDRTSSGLS